ncbi:spore germination protein [Neobacillus sp. DY30]|uniref:spore germination protein n=1 Tax=Neobacillus sp. DY30 TaxID=3047871 RepID=UPI0024BF80FE|nr:spore germination protein [Neobacillus sp. DY30]WHY01508.1 spore germination protein [Neobacillus sp. DY30]
MRLLRWLEKKILKSNQNGDHRLFNKAGNLHSNQLKGQFHDEIKQLKMIFERSSDIVFREFQLGGIQKGGLIFLDGMVDSQIIDSDVVKPLLDFGKRASLSATIPLKEMEAFLRDQVIYVSQVSIGQTMKEVVDHILNGGTVLLLEGVKQSLFISAPAWQMRSVEEPSTEAVIRGSREGFTENLRTNTSLIRRRLKTPQLKMEEMTVGRLSNTKIAITYLEGIAEQALVAEVKERIGQIDIDAILESNYIEELIQDNPYSVFPQVNNTERPDKVAAYLLEGKIGILVDNTPFALLVPVSFYEMLQSSEDYYQHFMVSTVIRWLRFFMLAGALLLPSLYIAITAYHQEMLPTTLLLSVSSGRETVPFPAFVEALIMEISFEGLREAGVRLPRPVGQAVSIVGALVIGQAAVQAGIVSASMVIIVSITGISSFIFPAFSQGIAIRLLRFPMMICAATLGLYGILVATLILLTHMARLRSFGVPYLSPVAPLNLTSLKDIYVRTPWWGMINRSDQTGKKNQERMNHFMRPRPPRRRN